jgi:hypothetical protein
MPIRERGLNRTDVPSEQELRNELQAEFAEPKDSGEPEIIIERPTPGTIHLYVIWSRWGDLEQVVRSRIILDAFEAVRGAEEVVQVTVSMGLTPEESKRLGIG